MSDRKTVTKAVEELAEDYERRSGLAHGEDYMLCVALASFARELAQKLNDQPVPVEGD